MLIYTKLDMLKPRIQKTFLSDNNMTVEKLIIIGSGPAALTAAIYAARAGLNPLVIEGPQPGGQLMGTSYVENWPGIESILGPQLMLDMRKHAEKFGARFTAETVIALSSAQQPFTIITQKNTHFYAHSIILATGAHHKKLNCPGESEYWTKGVSNCAVCDGAFFRDKKVIVIGGGDSAMEDASFMTNFTDHITIIHILDKLTASHAMQERILKNPKISILYESSVKSILGDGNRVTGIEVADKKTGVVRQIEADAVFVAIGLAPNSNFIKGSVDLLENGYVKVENHTKTSVEGIFVAGDVADYRYRQAVTAAGSGCMAALDAERYLKTKGL